MNDNLVPLRERAADAVADARAMMRDRVRELGDMRIEVSAGRSVAATLILIAGAGVALWLWTAHVKRERDQHWRDKIAAASESVRGAMLAGGREAEAQDRIIIDTIRGTDNALTDARDDLRKAGEPQPPLADCPRTPARCLGLNGPAGGTGGLR